MQARFPKFDFSRFRARWAPNPEFAQSYNAFSIVPAYIEPYLVKVMTLAKRELDPAHTRLHEEMKVFIRQEVQHCKQHVAFNKFMHGAGYSGMLPIEKEYNADYERQFATRSLKFNLAYCEGFEAMGCTAAEVWFSGALDRFLEGADEYAVQLWKWHLAEEFEHRTVCHDVLHTMFGRGIWRSVVNGYFYRVYGLFVAMRHINGYTRRCADYLIAKDLEGADAQERERSAISRKAFEKAVRNATLPRLLKVLSPFYNPRSKRMPPAMSDLLARYASPATTQPAG
jgi:predicted metal-dependent hydrolase